MRLASRLHSGSLARCQRETGARQFVKWLAFFREEDEREVGRTEKWEHYAARLSALILSANGRKVTEEEMLIKFRFGDPERLAKPPTKEERTRQAKTFWSAFFAAHGASRNPVSTRGMK